VKQLLAVDDSALIRAVIKSVADALEYETLEARNVPEALAVLGESAAHIRLVTIDWHMPGENGLALVRSMKSNPRTANIPVIMITTELERANVLKALQEGVDDYLTKPFGPEELATKIIQMTGP